MSKLELSQAVPSEYDKPSMVAVISAITRQINGVSEGRIAQRYNAQASAPAGSATAYAVGDFVPDSNCTVRGSVAAGVAAAYVRLGWVCVAPGSPGTFVEARVLTGT